jgi:hypothetical protein
MEKHVGKQLIRRQKDIHDRDFKFDIDCDGPYNYSDNDKFPHNSHSVS